MVLKDIAEVQKLNIKFHIFDADGTLFDSMKIWDNLAKDYLRLNKVQFPPDINNMIENLNLKQSALFFNNLFGIKKDPLVIEQELEDMIFYKYKRKVKLFKWVKPYLKDLYKKHETMVIFTTGSKKCVFAALKHNHIDKYIKDVYTTKDTIVDKSNPNVYMYLLNIMGKNYGFKIKSEEVCVYEDSLAPIKNASSFNCNVVDLSHVYNSFN